MGYAGEQENKKLKIQGGLTGITRGVSSRKFFFLISHVVSEVENKLREISHSQKQKLNMH